MKTFLYYMKSKIKLTAVFLVFCMIFAEVFSLYSLPLEAVLYAFLLCASLGFIVFTYDYLRFYRKHKTLEEIQKSLALWEEHHPPAANLIEEDYIQLIQMFSQERQRLASKTEKELQDMIDYYTLWVHQIKTPIAAMQLILQEEDTRENRELLGQLFTTEQYVEMVLAYLRMGSDTTDYVLKEHDLDEIVKQSIRKYATMFIGKKIRLDLEPIDVKVVTDEKWLCFVIEQILSNAIKYTAKGSISIYAENDSLIIRDTGIGIASEDLPRVMEKGYTGYNGRIDKKASGIGLYLSKQILERLGHHMTIESVVSEGTTVRIKLGTEIVSFE